MVPDTQTVLSAFATIVSIYGAYYTRRQYQHMISEAQELPRAARRRGELVKPPPWWRSSTVIALAVLVVLAWMPVFLTPKPVKNYNFPMAWGQIFKDVDGKEALSVTADLSQFVDDFSSKYRALAVALHYRGNIDQADSTGLQKSAAYDIRKGNQKFLIYPDQSFIKKVNAGIRGPN